MKTIIVINIVYASIVVLGLIYLLYQMIRSRKNNNYPNNIIKDNPKISIMIPARDESKVIKALLDSIAVQTYQVKTEDIYVIVETEDDPTVKIALDFGATIIYRRDLTKKRKGYALDDCLCFMKENNKIYDMYFIFDADNTLKEDFIEKMVLVYKKGYDAGLGCRLIKNEIWTNTVICSGLTFNMINTMGNEKKTIASKNILFSGTGMYISRRMIEDFKDSFPFNTLTEDYELSIYSTIKGYTTCYEPKAYFYDAQPQTFKQSVVQRSRWVKGFFQVRFKYAKQLKKACKESKNNKGSILSNLISIRPYYFMIAGIVIGVLSLLVATICFAASKNDLWQVSLANMLGLILFSYLVIVIFTFIMIQKDDVLKKWKLKHKIKGILINPLFLLTYVHCALIALFKKNLGWDKICHCEETK